MISATRLAASFGLALAVFSLAAFGQPSTVDPAFAPVPSIQFTSGDAPGKGVLVQPDGKIIIYGGNLVVDGVAKGEIARLNVDGTIDNTFVYCGCLLANLSTVRVQADGKILIAGNSGGRAKVVRLNSDGSHDPTFVSALEGGNVVFSSAALNTIQPDGKILIQFTTQLELGFHSGAVMRLNTDGSTDSGFTAISYDGGRLIFGSLTALTLDPAGKIYVAVRTSSGGSSASVLRRHNSDGTLDSGWTQPAFSPASNTEYNGLVVEPDGSLLISGRFDTVNGLSKQNLVRILPAGNVDMGFTPAFLGNTAGQLIRLPDGKLLVGYSITGNGLLTRLNSDGSSDPTFVLSPSVSVVYSRFVVDASGRILFFGVSNTLLLRYFRLNVNGGEDLSFNPNVTKFGTVRSLALQPDGKIIIAGSFSQLNGVARASMGRVNSDGTLDNTFDPGTGFDQPPARLVVQPDGKIIASGGFTSYNGAARPGLIRINSDGTFDGAFGPAIDGGSVLTASLQSDGRILIGGNFTLVGSTSRTGVARLSSSGVLDDVFNPVIGSPSITEIFQQADGKIMVGGGFLGVNGFNRSAMVRLNDNGSLDLTFDATGVGSVEKIYLQADGRYLVTGGTNLRRRNSDGSADGSFVSPAFASSSSATIDIVILQSDQTLIVGGRFDTVNGVARRNLVRLTSTGMLDPLFFPSGPDGAVRAALRQPDGKVIIGGEFGRVENVIRSGVARLSVAPFRFATPFDFDGDGRADISVVRPSTNRWYEVLSSTGGVHEETFGLAGDMLAPADFDGDGITDESIYRPSNGQWWYRSSLNGGLVLNQFGAPGDIPRPSDFDGDGKADLVLFKPANSTWHRWSSLTRQGSSVSFGLAGDQPLVGDFDGDGKSDLAVFRPSTGDWWYAATSAGGAFRTAHWGQNGDIPVPADYDGDRKTDFAIFRPSDGGWYIYNSGNGSFTILAFGTNGDRPIAADYDGDGRADIGVFRPSTGIWYLYQTTSGFAGYQFGISTDIAIPGSLLP